MQNTPASKRIVLALDAMGGDHAPQAIIDGAALAVKTNLDVDLHFYGDEKKISPLLEKHPKLKALSTIFHTDEFIANDEKPTVAIRRKGTSMRLAVESVKEGRAHGVVSAGNTGAYMALSKIILRPIPGVQRPAIASIIPTINGPAVLLDMGANLECTAEHLVQFALMGSIYAKDVLGMESPSIGLVNVGEEEQKGHESLKEATSMLKAMGNLVNFKGYIEGDDIVAGKVDVVVTDGFTGNVIIKTGEGIVRSMGKILRKTLMQNFLSRIGALLCIPAFKKLKSAFDPARFNGAIFIGLKHVAIKSHGSASAKSFANAMNVALKMIHHDFRHQIESDIESATDILADTEISG